MIAGYIKELGECEKEVKKIASKSKTDIVVALILIAVCSAVLIYSLSFPVSDRSVGVATFPRILAGLLIGLSVLQIILVLLKVDGGVRSPFRIPKRTMVLICSSMGMVILYILILKLLGFLLATILLMAALVILFGERSLLRILAVSFSVTIAIYLIFHILARVPFPEGVIENLLQLS